MRSPADWGGPEPAVAMEVAEPPARRQTVLLLPASTRYGGGEVVRCRMLAAELGRARPELRIVLAAFREIPLPGFEHEVVRLSDSPTRATAEVRAAIDRWAPDLVIFDSAGRSSLARYARRGGARTVFISVRRTGFRRATRLRWARWLDDHWAVRPDCAAPPTLSRLRRWLLGRLRHHTLLDLQVLFAPPDVEAGRRLLARAGVRSSPVVLCAGAGGTRAGGRNMVEVFGDVAARLPARLPPTSPVLLVAGPLYRGPLPSSPGVHVVPSLEPTEMVNVLANASAAVTGGGSLAPIAAALGLLVCAMPADRAEQRLRIRGLGTYGVTALPQDPVEAANRVAAVMGGARPAAPRPRIRNGMPVVLQRVHHLLASAGT